MESISRIVFSILTLLNKSTAGWKSAIYHTTRFQTLTPLIVSSQREILQDFVGHKYYARRAGVVVCTGTHIILIRHGSD